MNTDAEVKKTNNKYILRSVIDVLGFSKLTLIGYLLVGVALIITERVYYFFGTYANQNADVKGLGDLITSWFGGGIFPHLSIFLVWFIAGIAAYLIFWLILVLFVDFYNNIVFSETFTHQQSFNKSNFWLAVLSRYLLRACALILTIFFGLIFVKFILPELFFRLDDTFSNFNIVNILYVPLSLLIVAVFIHICVVLLRIATLKRRLIYDGEPPRDF